MVAGVRLLHRKGNAVAFELSIVSLLNEPTVNGLVVTAHDISARAAAERELVSTASQLAATLESTADGILVVDRHRRVTSFNRQFVRLWRLPEDVLALRDDATALQLAADKLEDPTEFMTRVEELYANPTAESSDTLVFKDGTVVSRYSRPQLIDGEVVGRVWSFRDVTAQKQLEEDLARLAFYDPLTGLANRTLLVNRLEVAIAKAERSEDYVAVLFLDVDNFKAVNDSLGHSLGDELLRSVARTVTECIRRSDTAARVGGDEFSVLVEGFTSRHEVVELARRIVASFARPLVVGAREASITVSVGVSFGRSASTPEELLSNADLAMYEAKANGKNRFEVYGQRDATAGA